MLGLHSGMPFADARAAVPDLHSAAHDPKADHRWLDQLAEDCGRYTPRIALDGPDGLLLDISGCAHLHGGEASLMDHVRTLMDQRAISLRCAIAGTAPSARALARHASFTVISTPLTPAEERRAIAKLPVQALDLDRPATIALQRAGLHDIGDLAPLPMAQIAARFGSGAASKLRQLHAEEDSPILPRQAHMPFIAEQCFAEPILSTDYALKKLGELVADIATAMAQKNKGGRQFHATFFRSDGFTRSIEIETSQPTRDPAQIMRLFSERVELLRDPIDPGFGFDKIGLTVRRWERLGARQTSWQDEAADAHHLIELADRLAIRLGRDHVRRYRPANSYIPEQAQLEWAASAAPAPGPWPMLPSHEPPTRPFYLLDPPEKIAVIAEVPDGPPLRFRWRQMMHDIRRYEGPERIAAEWWKRADNGGLTRDYYRVEDEKGRRYWVFRHGLYREKPAPHWYIHGLFA